MFVELDTKWAKHLSELPETGMGYQLVDVTLASGQTYQRMTVLSGYMLCVPDATANFTSDDIVDITLAETDAPC